MARRTIEAGRGQLPRSSHVDRQDFGYNARQVDDFLARAREYFNNPEPDDVPITSHDVRAMTFDPAKGGYDPRAVDAALDRLEDVFAQRERDALIRREGEQAWLTQIGRTSAMLRGQAAPRPRRTLPPPRQAECRQL